MSTPALPPTWQVTGTAETTQLTDAGQIQPGILVNFTTSRGHQGSVFLAMAAATPDNVRAAIEARVRAIEGIATLKSD